MPISAVLSLPEVLPFSSCVLPPPRAFLTAQQFPEQPEPGSHGRTGSGLAPGTSPGMEEVTTVTQTRRCLL